MRNGADKVHEAFHLIGLAAQVIPVTVLVFIAIFGTGGPPFDQALAALVVLSVILYGGARIIGWIVAAMFE